MKSYKDQAIQAINGLVQELANLRHELRLAQNAIGIRDHEIHALQQRIQWLENRIKELQRG